MSTEKTEATAATAAAEAPDDFRFLSDAAKAAAQDAAKSVPAATAAVEAATAAAVAAAGETAQQAEPEAVMAFDPPVDLAQRVEQVRAAPNPLMEAARLLLRMLADMPVSLESQDAVTHVRSLLVRELNAFQMVCDKAGLQWTHMAAVRYCLSTALDEAANRTRWGGGGVWAKNSLLITFEGENDGGEKFFLLIGRMATDPQAYIDVLEILYRILGLGFEGRYSVIEDGRRHLEQVRHRLATLISGARDAVQVELSPHWRGAGPGKLRALRSVPAWSVAGALALVVLGLFGWYKYQLLASGRALEARILEIGRQQLGIRQERLRLSFLLREEIARGLVTVDENDQRSVVVFKGDSMFLSGQDKVRQEMDPILEKVAREVARVGGKVTVTGHTDNQAIRTRAFPDNQVLSEKRAEFVSQILQAHGTPAGRIEAVGRGETAPVAGNATPQDRARNRRVEVVVTQ